jgi:cytochrome P450
MASTLPICSLGPLPVVLAEEMAGAVRRVHTPTGDEMWLVGDYALGRQVLADPAFSRAAAARPETPRLSTANPSPTSIVSMDGHEHARLRRIIATAFTARKVAKLAPLVDDVAGRLLAEMAGCGAPADLVSSFAAPLPVTVLGALLGVPARDRHIFGSSIEVMFDITASSAEQKARQQLHLVGYMSELIDRKKQCEDDDLLTEMVRAHDDGALSKPELISLALALLTAGYETTVGQICLSVLTLLNGVVSADELTGQAQVNTVVEEILRTNPSTSIAFPRVAVRDVLLGDARIRAGEAVIVSLIHGNRDSKVFAEPHELRGDRSASHLTFGHGVHRCLGAPLARLQVRTALVRLFGRFPGLRLAADSDAICWKDGLITRGLTELYVTW